MTIKGVEYSFGRASPVYRKMQNEGRKEETLRTPYVLPDDRVTLRGPSGIAARGNRINQTIAQKPSLETRSPGHNARDSANRRTGAISPFMFSKVKMSAHPIGTTTSVRNKNVSRPLSPTKSQANRAEAASGLGSKGMMGSLDAWMDQLIPSKSIDSDKQQAADFVSKEVQRSGSTTSNTATRTRQDTNKSTQERRQDQDIASTVRRNASLRDLKERSSCELTTSPKQTNNWVEFPSQDRKLASDQNQFPIVHQNQSNRSSPGIKSKAATADCSKSATEPQCLSFTDLAIRSTASGVSLRFSVSNSGSTNDRLERAIGIPSTIYVRASHQSETGITPLLNGVEKRDDDENQLGEHDWLERFIVEATPRQEEEPNQNSPNDQPLNEDHDLYSQDNYQCGRPMVEIVFERRLDKNGMLVDDDCSEITHPLFGTIQKTPLRG